VAGQEPILLPHTIAACRQHVLHPPGSPRSGLPPRHPSGVGSSVEEGVVGQPEVAVVQRTGSGRVHEYSALPGDLHPAQLAKAAKGLRCEA
jgi:hypothetical protein